VESTTAVRWSALSLLAKELEHQFEITSAVPDTDEELRCYTIGDTVRGSKEPQCFMVGHHNMPVNTVEVLRKFWFHTGDARVYDDAVD
jgi:hypothetical protein